MTSENRIDLESLKRKKFLLADDLEGSRVLGALFLKIAGAEVSVVSSGEEAVKKALKGPYDAVLIDLHMPEMNGLDATQKLREMGYQNPIVIVSGDSEDRTVQRATAIGANRFLAKPFKLSGLVETLKDVLSIEECAVAPSDSELFH